MKEIFLEPKEFYLIQEAIKPDHRFKNQTLAFRGINHLELLDENNNVVVRFMIKYDQL